jgi:anti-sigma28 factor (negative regulator of flagellin synthesis)
MGFGTRISGSEQTMKIDPRTESSREVAPTATDATRQPSKPAEKTPDAVQLSAQVRLADEAVRAAAISGDVRPAAVEKARALLQSGQLARDLGSLADRIIDSLVQSRDSSKP